MLACCQYSGASIPSDGGGIACFVYLDKGLFSLRLDKGFFVVYDLNKDLFFLYD